MLNRVLMKKVGQLNLIHSDRAPIELSFGPSEESYWGEEFVKNEIFPEKKEWIEEIGDEIKKSFVEGHFRLEKLSEEYLLKGDFHCHLPVQCGRCTDPFWEDRYGDFQIVIKLEPKTAISEDDNDDPNFLVLNSPNFSFSSILKDLILVEEAIAPCPERKSDGSCSYCGKNPQFSGGQDFKKGQDSPFSVLGGLKGKL